MNTRIIRYLFGTTIALMIGMLLLALPIPVSSAPAFGLSMFVTTTADEYDTSGSGTGCALREAIHLANTAVSHLSTFGGCSISGTSGLITIFVPSGTYTLTRTGAGEDLDVTGDLDITNTVTISTTGAVTVAGNTGWDDRIFDILTGTVTIKGLVITGGAITGDDGGGIRNLGEMILTDVTLSTNHAGNSGGGLFNSSGTATLTNVTLSGNDAPVGGGIYTAGGLASLTNVTLSGNDAVCGVLCFGSGGGIFITGTATLNLTNVTLSGNGASFGSGIYKVNGTVAFTNTIVANQGGNANCNTTIGGSFNIADDGTCGFGFGDNANVHLSPLGNYGGPTLTYIPYGDSAAIDGGTNTGCPSTDQRGKPRPVNSVCDVGAVERQAIDAPYLYLPLILR
jgi:CSLREA domain-containing protein